MFTKDMALYLYKLLAIKGVARTSEGVMLWLVIEKQYPGLLSSQVIPGGWEGKGGPLEMKNLVALAKAMKDSRDPEEEVLENKFGKREIAQLSGNWSQLPSWVWGELFEFYLGCELKELKEDSGEKEKEHKTKGGKKRRERPLEKKEKEVEKEDVDSTTSNKATYIKPHIATFSDFWRIVVDGKITYHPSDLELSQIALPANTHPQNPSSPPPPPRSENSMASNSSPGSSHISLPSPAPRTSTTKQPEQSMTSSRIFSHAILSAVLSTSLRTLLGTCTNGLASPLA